MTTIMKLTPLKVLLLALFISLGLTSCDDITGSWTKGYLDCELLGRSNGEGYFESPYMAYQLRHIENNQGFPLRGDIREVSMQDSWIEVSTPDNIRGRYLIKNLIIRFGDSPSLEYKVGDIYVYGGEVVRFSHPSFISFMSTFAYNLDRYGEARIAADGFVYDGVYLVRGANIDVIVKNNFDVRTRD